MMTRRKMKETLKEYQEKLKDSNKFENQEEYFKLKGRIELLMELLHPTSEQCNEGIYKVYPEDIVNKFENLVYEKCVKVFNNYGAKFFHSDNGRLAHYLTQDIIIMLETGNYSDEYERWG
jgi:hypothetical protein